MKRKFVLVIAALVFLCLGTTAQAVTVLPNSVSPEPPVSPAFSNPVAGGIITNQYKQFGLMFGPDPVAIFTDSVGPPRVDAWGGVNASNIIDLISPVSGFFVLPNTTTPALTAFVSVEVGYIPNVDDVKLEVFDANGNLLASSFADDGIGPHDNGGSGGEHRYLATVFADGIHSFLVTGTTNTWGMDQIAFCSDLKPVPVPPTALLLGSGLLGLVGLRFRRN
jgi:hypothetical protein